MTVGDLKRALANMSDKMNVASFNEFDEVYLLERVYVEQYSDNNFFGKRQEVLVLGLKAV